MASNRPLAVYISSPSELFREQLAIQAALTTYSRYGWVAESSNSLPGSTRRVHLDKIADCDVFIGLLGPDSNQTTIEEVEHALQHHKLCLLYEKSAGNEQRDTRLSAFCDNVQTNSLTVSRIENNEQLVKQVQTDVMRLLMTQFRESRKQPLPLPRSISTSTGTKNKGMALSQPMQWSNGPLIKPPSP